MIDWPFSFCRDYTVPLAEEEAWDKVRAIIVLFTMVPAFFYLFGFLSFTDEEATKTSMEYLEIAGFCCIPALPIAVYIYFCTKKT